MHFIIIFFLLLTFSYAFSHDFYLPDRDVPMVSVTFPENWDSIQNPDGSLETQSTDGSMVMTITPINTAAIDAVMGAIDHMLSETFTEVESSKPQAGTINHIPVSFIDGTGKIDDTLMDIGIAMFFPDPEKEKCYVMVYFSKQENHKKNNQKLQTIMHSFKLF